MSVETINKSSLLEMPTKPSSSKGLNRRAAKQIEECLVDLEIGDTQRDRIKEYALFLAGLIEASKAFDFDIYPDKIYPKKSYSDNREGKIKRLREFFGGRIIPDTDSRSREWRIESDAALFLTETVALYSPSSTHALIAFKKWELTDNYEERLAIAKEYKLSRKKGFNLSTSDYRDLVDNPAFMAGVFEGAGALYYRKNRKRILDKEHPFIGFSIKNNALREAIRLKYFDNPSQGKDKNFFRLGKGDSANMISQIQDYMVNDLFMYAKYDEPKKEIPEEIFDLPVLVAAGR